MSTSDDSFRATDRSLFGFLAESDDDNVPQKPFGVVGYGFMTGILGFSGDEAGPEGPIQQNSYSLHAGVEGGSVEFTGVAGVSLAGPGVYGQVEDAPPVPAGFRAGVLGAASTQPGVIGFSRDGDGAQGASFTGTAVRACERTLYIAKKLSFNHRLGKRCAIELHHWLSRAPASRVNSIGDYLLADAALTHDESVGI